MMAHPPSPPFTGKDSTDPVTWSRVNEESINQLIGDDITYRALKGVLEKKWDRYVANRIVLYYSMYKPYTLFIFGYAQQRLESALEILPYYTMAYEQLLVRLREFEKNVLRPEEARLSQLELRSLGISQIGDLHEVQRSLVAAANKLEEEKIAGELKRVLREQDSKTSHLAEAMREIQADEISREGWLFRQLEVLLPRYAGRDLRLDYESLISRLERARKDVSNSLSAIIAKQDTSLNYTLTVLNYLLVFLVVPLTVFQAGVQLASIYSDSKGVIMRWTIIGAVAPFLLFIGIDRYLRYRMRPRRNPSEKTTESWTNYAIYL